MVSVEGKLLKSAQALDTLVENDLARLGPGLALGRAVDSTLIGGGISATSYGSLYEWEDSVRIFNGGIYRMAKPGWLFVSRIDMSRNINPFIKWLMYAPMPWQGRETYGAAPLIQCDSGMI